jgi:hypothetical protein
MSGFDYFATIIENLKHLWDIFSYGEVHWEKEIWITRLLHFDAKNLPFALKGILAPRPHMAMMRISKVFRRVCNKIWDPSEFESL